ncbi:MAG: hypothetical protein ACO4CS_03890 [bacterium]|jgi:hypothetical protein
MTNVKTRRSNKPVTQFACNALEDWLEGTNPGFRGTRENTTVDYICGRYQYFKVYLWKDEILSIIALNGDIQTIRVSVGNFFAAEDGSPSLTTRERLNGLLDLMSYYQIIPDHVHVFRDKETRICYFGRGDQKIAVGKNYAKTVLIRPDSNVFEIQVSDMEMPQMYIRSLDEE